MACFAFVACDDNPVSADRDATVTLAINPSLAIVDAADTTRVSAVGRNQYGENTQVALTYTTCDAKIDVEPDPTRVAVEPPDRWLVMGRTLGESCVEFTAGGVAGTAKVFVVPADMEVTLPSYTLESGQASQATVVFLDVAGASVSGFDISQVNMSVADAAVADVDAAGLVFPKAPGTTEVSASLVSAWGASRSGSAEFTVVPGPFLGGASATSGGSGDGVTYTADPGQPDFDSDTEVTVGGVKTFVFDLSSLTTAIPWGLEAGANDVLFTQVGGEQLALVTSFDVATLETTDDLEPNDDPFAPAGPVTFPFEDLLAVDYEDLDDFIAFSLAAETSLHLFLDWDEDVNGDMDLLVVDAAFTAYQCGFVTATAAIPEEGNCTLGAGDYLLWVNNYAEAGLTNYHIEVTVNP